MLRTTNQLDMKAYLYQTFNTIFCILFLNYFMCMHILSVYVYTTCVLGEKRGQQRVSCSWSHSLVFLRFRQFIDSTICTTCSIFYFFPREIWTSHWLQKELKVFLSIKFYLQWATEFLFLFSFFLVWQIQTPLLPNSQQ